MLSYLKFYYYFSYLFFNKILYLYKIKVDRNKILGIGDWGLGIGGWGFGPIPQNPKPKPQNPKNK